MYSRSGPFKTLLIPVPNQNYSGAISHNYLNVHRKKKGRCGHGTFRLLRTKWIYIYIDDKSYKCYSIPKH